ncbi:MAG TPA: lytic transglycosylase domain-containing protein [Thiobacillaceae bacterium]|nr:lytic transglycosylase domain-containing protein [Thiobacillaceae bacterium]HNA82692.1 lytic transglycosylase domain-containing protein [Thiobacillaceae bacterium]HNF90361.1 lytic transglycosylase domain-containing protein [Thiobacillaceae bacterium]HNH88934.1 lytic transglycosylase domain-containing protein [Thiobacillaceae bacterium]HNI09007.1 lytic transglycosylase domain-containing protein [Thiobacillaceae bacterium]
MSNRGLKILLWLAAFLAGPALAGAQKYEPLSASVRSQLSKAVADSAVEKAAFAESPYVQAWLAEMSKRMARYIPDPEYREDFLNTVHYESLRAGVDPELVLGLIEVESGFRKYAVSSATAQGYMQVMPFWVNLIGTRDQNLFHLRTNLRYGVTILRHYIDIERGDLFRALGRYNGSLGQPDYPNAVYAAWRNKWTYGLAPKVKPKARQAEATPFKKGT